MKRKNKKGMFFTILVIALLSLFLASYSIYFMVTSRESINKRIKTMDNFVSLVEDDLPRKLYISGFRGIFLFQKRIIENGTYIDDVNLRFKEFFLNGTINGELRADELNITAGVLFVDIQNTLEYNGKSINVNVTLSSPDVNISQEDPWNVKVDLKVDLLIEDLGNLALWNKTFNTSTYVPIEGFEDPIYLISTGIVSNKINKTIYEGFSSTDTINLSGHVQKSYYIASSSAPSFLNRLEGNLSADVNGIESLVNLPVLEGQGVSTDEKSCVDYIYFDGSNPEPGSKISGMPDWFRLDDAHLSVYNATAL